MGGLLLRPGWCRKREHNFPHSFHNANVQISFRKTITYTLYPSDFNLSSSSDIICSKYLAVTLGMTNHTGRALETGIPKQTFFPLILSESSHSFLLTFHLIPYTLLPSHSNSAIEKNKALHQI